MEVRFFFTDKEELKLPEGFRDTKIEESRDNLIIISGTIPTKNFFDTELFEKNPSLFGYEIL